MPTVEHPRIAPGALEERAYQAEIARIAADRNTLVVLPTGLGKTAIGLRVAAEWLRRTPTRSILWLAPTRPLVLQTAEAVRRTLLAPPPIGLTGAVAPERRRALLAPPQVVVATPQVIAHDLAAGNIDLAAFSLLVFDEAHRATGDYPYVAIGRSNAAGPRRRVLAMTASPGDRIERIRELWANLGLEHFEYRTDRSPDVRPYIHGFDLEPVVVKVPVEVQRLGILLRTAIARPVNRLRELGLLDREEGSRRALLEVGEKLRRASAAARSRGERGDARLWSAVTAQAVAMKGLHALELAETQGVGALREFFRRQAELASGRPSPSLRAFLNDPDVQAVRQTLEALELEHPKIEAAVRVVRETLERTPTARAIVFSQYRDTVDRLVEEFGRQAPGVVRAARFVGQTSRSSHDPGLSQKEQAALLDRFRSGEINCLVATSVAEEGLDIPSTDLVVFYEPIPDVVRTIQRRGRTGRARTGRVVVLVAENTRDSGLQRGASARERRMHAMLEAVAAEARQGGVRPAPPRPPVQTVLTEFAAGSTDPP